MSLHATTGGHAAGDFRRDGPLSRRDWTLRASCPTPFPKARVNLACGWRSALVRDDLLRLVMSRGLRLTIVGVAIGAIAALTLTRLMGNLLYKVSPRDPLSFGVAFIVMTLVALVACFLPAWRATRIDPVRALRT